MPDFSIAGDKSQDRKSAVTSDGRRSARHLADNRHCRRSLVFREHPSAARRTLGNSVLVVTTKASVGPGPEASVTSVSIQTGPTARLVLVERSNRPRRSSVPPFVPTGRVPTRTGQRTSSGHPGIEGPSASTAWPHRREAGFIDLFQSSIRAEPGPRSAISVNRERIERAARSGVFRDGLHKA